MNRVAFVSEYDITACRRYVVEHAVVDGWEVAGTIMDSNGHVTRPTRFHKLQEAVQQVWYFLQDGNAQIVSGEGRLEHGYRAKKFRIVDMEKRMVFNVIEQNHEFYVEFPINQTRVRMTSLFPMVTQHRDIE
jgi:hypothetical protein